MHVPDKVSLRDMQAEINKRVTLKRHEFFLTEFIIPHNGYCKCIHCIVERVELYKNLSARIEDLDCNNKPWMAYCEQHGRFYHPNDDCPICTKPKQWSVWPKPKEEFFALLKPAQAAASSAIQVLCCPGCGFKFDVIWGTAQVLQSMCEKCGTLFQVGRPNGQY
jgi:hypothetical protein